MTSIVSKAREAGVKVGPVRYAIKNKKYNIDEAIEWAKNKGKNNATFFYGGLTLRQWCRENNVSYPAVMQRMYRGLNLEESIKKVQKGLRQCYYEIGGVSVRELLPGNIYNLFLMRVSKDPYHRRHWQKIYNELRKEIKNANR